MYGCVCDVHEQNKTVRRTHDSGGAALWLQTTWRERTAQHNERENGRVITAKPYNVEFLFS